MKKSVIYILAIVTFLFTQDPIMERVESLHTVEAYPVGRIVSINGLGDIFAVNSDNSEVYVLKNGSNSWSRILDNNTSNSVTGIYNSTDNAVFIKTNSTGLYYSSNTSTYSLTQILVETTAFSVAENSLGTIYCGSTDGLYKSDNNGTSWSITYEYPLKMSIDLSNDVMYIDEYNKGLCRSTDLGITWEEINYNMPKDSVINDIQIATDGTVFISVKNNGMYKLSGTEWVTQGFNYTSVNSIHAGKDGYMYCSLGDKIYKKTVAMSYWTEIKSSQGKITSFSSSSNKLIAGYTDDLLIFETTDWGSTWTTNGQIIYPTVLSVLTYNNYVFAGTDSGIFTSNDYGATWQNKQLDIPVYDIELERYGRIAIGTGSGLYRSSDFGASWVKRTSCPVDQVQEVLFTNDYIYYVSGYWDLYKSTDYGSTWTKVPDDNFYKPYDIEKLSTGRLFIADMHSGIWYTDDELSWTDSGLGIWTVNIESDSSDDIYAQVSGGLKVLRSGNSTWDTCLSEYVSSLFIGSDDIILTGCGDFCIRYSNSGSVWDTIYGTPSASIIAVEKDGNGYVYAGIDENKGLYKSNIPLEVK